MQIYEATPQILWWFLTNTQLCHVNNFMACWFAGPWDQGDAGMITRINQNLVKLQTTATYPMARLLAPTCRMSRVLHARKSLSYSCLVESLNRVRNMSGSPSGLLFISHDMAVIRPWPSLRSALLTRNITVLMGLFNDTLAVPETWFHPEMYDTAARVAWKPAGPRMDTPAKMTVFGTALKSLPDASRVRIGGVIRKAFSDALFVPMWQAPEFSAYATIMYKHQVYFEWALPTITLALNGPARSILTPEDWLIGLYLRGHERTRAVQAVADLRRWQYVAFLHPLGALGGVAVRQADTVKQLYAEIFAPGPFQPR